MQTGLSLSIRTVWRNLFDQKQSANLIYTIFSVALMILVSQAPSLQAQQTADVSNPSKKEASTSRIKIRRLQQGISHQESKMSETRAKERNILAELEELDKRLADQQEKLEVLKKKIQQQQLQIDREENALAKIHSEKFIVQNHLKKRIVAYYTMGEIGLFNVTFSTRTLPELLTFRDSFETLIKYDQEIIKVYKETIRELERVKTALDLEKSVLENFIDQTKEEQKLLKKTRSEKRVLLSRVRTQTELHKQAALEMQQASEKLAQSISSVKSKKQQVYEQNFITSKGNLPPPVDGTLVTLFNQEKINKLGISRVAQGIELQAPDGIEIVAVSTGEVVFSGYLRGYGNTVIIHHGSQYHTVTSRIEKIVVAKGQKVGREEKIGVMGDTATLFDEGLYFELRHDRESLDPLLWLDPNRLSTFNEHPASQSGLDSSVY